MPAPGALGKTILKSGTGLESDTEYRKNLGIAESTLSNIEFILSHY